jgi:sugar lactone lactonase YvrE
VNDKDDIFVADYQNCRVRRIDHSTKIIQTIAGDGKCESRGEGELATNASLNYPSALAIDKLGNVFVMEGVYVKRIDPDGIITNYAGNGKKGFGGDGGQATDATIGTSGIALDSDGNLYIAEFSNNRIRRVDAKTHIITTVAGNGKPFRIDSVM